VLILVLPILVLLLLLLQLQAVPARQSAVSAREARVVVTVVEMREMQRRVEVCLAGLGHCFQLANTRYNYTISWDMYITMFDDIIELEYNNEDVMTR
jgi:hypothetical protein